MRSKLTLERNNTEPPILRIHRLITKGTSEKTADELVIEAVTTLQDWGKRPLQLQPAPARGDLTKLLSEASRQAKPLYTRNTQPQTAA